MWLASDIWALISATTQFILVIWGAFVGLQADWAKKHRVLALAVFVIVGLVGVSAIIQQSNETVTANTKLQGSLNNINTSTQEIARLTSLNTKLQEQLLDSNKRIIALSKQSIDTVTGGDSFCYMVMRNRQSFVTIVHQGKYPLYGLSARVVDLNKLRAEKDAVFGTPIHIGNLGLKSAKMIKNFTFTFSDSGQQDFNIFFSSDRGGFWTQLLRWRLIDGEWVSATRVDRDSIYDPKRTLLYERIDPKFPKNEKGQVDWEEPTK